MLTAHKLRLRKAQQIEELRHRLQYSTSPEERELIRQSLDFWLHFHIPADPEPDTTTEPQPAPTKPKGFAAFHAWFTRKSQPALH